jgi:SAM-dependent methyltransferase
MRHSLAPIKRFVREIPIFGPSLIRLRSRLFKLKSSSEYWEQRYRMGGNSGAGSYNRLAEFKANFLNRFVEEHKIASVIEYGCGDGAQLKLAKYPRYTGVDVSVTAVERCRALFDGDPSKKFLHSDAQTSKITADLALSLDVIYHLVEDSVFDTYMRRLFDSAARFVIIYSSNVDQPWSGSHVRHRHFTRWIEKNTPDWHLVLFLKNAYPYDDTNPAGSSFADFYIFELV